MSKHSRTYRLRPNPDCPTAYDVQVDDEQDTRWSLQTLTPKDVQDFKYCIKRGARICLFGKLKAGRFLLYNYEDDGCHVLDTLVDVFDRIEEQYSQNEKEEL